MSVTDADRRRAREILDTAPLLDLGGAIAAALAEEREKARAPFRKMADQIKDGWRPDADRLADAIYAYTGGYDPERAAEEAV